MRARLIKQWIQRTLLVRTRKADLADALAREYAIPIHEAKQVADLCGGDAALARSFLALALATSIRPLAGIELRKFDLGAFAVPRSERPAIHRAFAMFTSDGCLLISSPEGAEVVAGILRKAVRAGYSTPDGKTIWETSRVVR